MIKLTMGLVYDSDSTGQAIPRMSVTGAAPVQRVQQGNLLPPKNRAPPGTIQTGYPMEVVTVDIMGPLPESKNRNAYILVAGDYFTTWMEAYAITNEEATTVAEKFVDDLFFADFLPLSACILI